MTDNATPTIVDQTEQPYAGVVKTVTMTTIGHIADAIPEIIAWLERKGTSVAGPPFLRYLRIDMSDDLDVEAGVPVAAPIDGDGDIYAGTLPAGRYATVTHRGHPDELLEVNDRLLSWADESGVRFDMTTASDGERWACRMERYLTNPAEQPDMHQWETQLAIKLAD